MVKKKQNNTYSVPINIARQSPSPGTIIIVSNLLKCIEDEMIISTSLHYNNMLNLNNKKQRKHNTIILIFLWD